MVLPGPRKLLSPSPGRGDRPASRRYLQQRLLQDTQPRRSHCAQPIIHNKAHAGTHN